MAIPKFFHSIYGRKVGVNESGALRVPGGLLTGSNGGIYASDSDHCAWFDDFLGDTLNATYTPLTGSDASGNVASVSILAGGINGVVRLAGADSTGSMAADGAQLAMYRNWRASNGGLVFEAKVALAVITNVSAFVGFTDKITLEAAITSAASADTITTNATDGLGFFFDTSMTTKNWWIAGVANNVDATPQNTGFAPVAATYETFRIEVSPAGNADFYRNGTQVGTRMAGAVTTSVALTPSLSIFPRTAAFGTQMDVDYLHVAQLR